MSKREELLPLSKALDIVRQQLADKMLGSETIPLRQALGRSVVEDQVSRLDIPAFDKSAMDGYAITADDERDEYRVLETVAAGQVPVSKLTPGTAVKVMTGATVPEGAGKVVMVEQTRMVGDKVRILSHAGSVNICKKGEDVRRGDVILKAPAVLGPAETANLISAGITKVTVSVPCRLAILATGDEIVDNPDSLGPGKIINCNGPMLADLARKYSMEVTCNKIVRDNLDVTIKALADAVSQADIVVLSGGVSVGDFDFVTEAIKQLGLEIHFNRLAIKPGKPMTFACGEKAVVFGLPGNPVAVFLMFHLFVLYAVRLLSGHERKLNFVKLPLAGDFHRRQAGRMAFLPCRLTQDGTLQSIEYHGTAHLLALSSGDGFFVVPKGVTDVSAGERLDYLALKGSFE